MTRQEAEIIAETVREYIDLMSYVAADRDNSKQSLTIQRLAFEKLLAALVKASRHG